MSKLNYAALPGGLSKKELMRLPEMKPTRRLFIWAGIVELFTGIVTFGQIGQAYSYYGYYAGSNLQGMLLIYGAIALLDIILGISLLISKSAAVAIAVGIEGIATVLFFIADGGQPGLGLIAIILALIGAIDFNRQWKEYTEYTRYIEGAGYVRFKTPNENR